MGETALWLHSETGHKQRVSPAILLLGTYPTKMRTHIHPEIHPGILVSELFMPTPRANQPTHVKSRRDKRIVVYSNTGKAS